MKPGIEAVLIEVSGVCEVPWKRSALESQITLFCLLTYSFCINELVCPVIILVCDFNAVLLRVELNQEKENYSSVLTLAEY